MSGDANTRLAKILGNSCVFFLAIIIGAGTTLVLLPDPEVPTENSFVRTESIPFIQFPKKVNSKSVQAPVRFHGCKDDDLNQFDSEKTITSAPFAGCELGCGGGSGGSETNIVDRFGFPQPSKKQAPSETLEVISKPQPKYTERARKYGIEGSVRLRVVFNADGSIGSIYPIKGLPCGLTNQAIKAARKIKFRTEIRDGRPISVKKNGRV